MDLAAVLEVPYDLAAIVDPVGGGREGAGDSDRGDTTGRVDEAMVPGAVGVAPYDLAAIVDSVACGAAGGAGDIDGGEQKPRGRLSPPQERGIVHAAMDFWAFSFHVPVNGSGDCANAETVISNIVNPAYDIVSLSQPALKAITSAPSDTRAL